jgi:osmoprotectant transport system substrate-binding protein
MRHFRMVALGASTLALIVSACTTGGSSTSPSSATIASTLSLGGPPECPQREFCAIGLESVYGLTFKEFKPLDAGGPVTVAAVESGQADVGLLFTSDPAIAAKGFVLLADDKQLQKSDNIAPVVRQAILDAHPEVTTILDGISAKLSQDELIDLNKQVAVDQTDPSDAAKNWLTAQGILPGPGGPGKGKIVVASFNFPESTTLAELYAQALEANGRGRSEAQPGQPRGHLPRAQVGAARRPAGVLASALWWPTVATRRPTRRRQPPRWPRRPRRTASRSWLMPPRRTERLRGDEGHGRQVRPDNTQRPRKPAP